MSGPSATALRLPVLVFDVGGVLSVPPFAAMDAYCAPLGVTGGIERYFRGDPDFALVETGELTTRDWFVRFLKRVESDHGLRLDADAFGAALAAGREFRPEMLELVAQLSRHHRLGILTNNTAENDDWLLSALPAGTFEVICNSARMGLRKPDPAIYEALLERLGCAGSDVVYVDDFVENLEPAAALGMRTVLFTDSEQCRRDLEALGVWTA
ncbi:MAG: HAD-superfamily hydrolase subfamily variant 3 [Frankiales bacterium]|nr:HAD-superfamily hydrolase subfamily variant 3 [Frankiales bacterium]